MHLNHANAAVVDVVRLVVEHGEFVDLADDLAQIGLAVGGLADWLARRTGRGSSRADRHRPATARGTSPR